MTELDVREAVGEYCRLHGLEAFAPSELYDLQTDYKKQYPHSGEAGCYIFLR
jgi:hypothetical protein